MDPLWIALISAGATALGIAIPVVWGARLERRCRALEAEKAAALKESAHWRALYYDLMTGGVDVQSRRTQLYHPMR
jgi:lysozyme family protein